MKTFKIINGKWQIKNICDALENSSFDLFINKHRKIEFVKLKTSKNNNIKKHNYEFTSRD